MDTMQGMQTQKKGVPPTPPPQPEQLNMQGKTMDVSQTLQTNQTLQANQTVQVNPVQQEQHQVQQATQAEVARDVVEKPARKRKKEKFGHLSARKAKQNFSQERSQAFHGNLLLNVQLDKAFQGSKEFEKVMKSMEEYASMDLMKTKLPSQYKKITALRKALNSYQDRGNEEETAIIERYRLYFSTFFDGTLKVPDDIPAEQKFDFADKNMRLDILPSRKGLRWKDVRDQPLFAREPTVEDVEQRGLGDCYLQAGLVALVAHSPEKLKKCIRDNGNGTVTVRFFQRGYNQDVDRMPEPLKKVMKETDVKKLGDAGELMLRMLQPKLHTKEDEAAMLKHREAKAAANPGAAAACKEIEKLLPRALENLELVDHAEELKSLADRLVQNEKLKPVVAAMMAEQQKEGATIASTLNAAYDAMFDLMQDPALADAVRADFEEDYKNIEHPKQPELKPIYVTVSKEVPVLGEDRDAFSANNRWVQLIEKAYAMSGLHEIAEKTLKKVADERNLKWGKDPELYGKLKEELKYSFERIEGGRPSEFLERLTGIPGRIDLVEKQGDHNQVMGYFASTFKQMSVPGIKNQDLIDRIGSTVTLVWGKKTSEISKKKDGKDSDPVPATIEDMKEVLMSIMEEENKEIFNMMQVPDALLKENEDRVKAGEPELNLEELLQAIADLMEEQLEQLDSNAPLQIQHRNLLERGGKAVYTKGELECYEQLQRDLAAGKIVNIGTREFGKKGLGRNGEGKEGGMVATHAYTVLGCEEKNGHRFVRVRNPWGMSTMSYTKITEKDGTVHFESAMKEEENSSKQTGMFLLELADFVRYTRAVHVNG